LDGQPTPALGWDATVSAQVQSVASQNGIVVLGAYYTDICGIPLRSDGTAALNLDGTMNLTVAAPVGTGIPASSATNPDCPALAVGPPAGVLTIGRKTVAAYVAGAIGISSFTPTA